jgi:iron(III) transport system substrate-binding protein
MGPEAMRAEVCEAAKAEGKLVYWHNLAHPDEIGAAFNATYPDIEIEWLQSRPDDMVQALLTEVSAGRSPSMDIMYGELNVLVPVFEQNLDDDSIDWMSFGVPEDILTEYGNVVRIQRVLGGIVYNTDTVKPEELPNTWNGLLDQTWKGQLVVDSRARPFDQFSLAWGHDQTIAYVKALLTNEPLVIRGGTAGMLAVAGQQAKITTGGRSESTEEERAKGAPLQIKYLDVIATFDAYNMVPKGVAHPNAAMCMVSWLATDGAEAFEKAELKENISRPSGASPDDVLVSVETPADAQAVSDIGTEIQELYAGLGG